MNVYLGIIYFPVVADVPSLTAQIQPCGGKHTTTSRSNRAETPSSTQPGADRILQQLSTRSCWPSHAAPTASKVPWRVGQSATHSNTKHGRTKTAAADKVKVTKNHDPLTSLQTVRSKHLGSSRTHCVLVPLILRSCSTEWGKKLCE